jgi:hypothetical protein
MGGGRMVEEMTPEEMAAATADPELAKTDRTRIFLSKIL